jgi:hypothetical protein
LSLALLIDYRLCSIHIEDNLEIGMLSTMMNVEC